MFTSAPCAANINAMRRPSVPAPMTATGLLAKLVGTLKLISYSLCRYAALTADSGWVQLGIGDTCEVALQGADRALAGSVQGGRPHVAPQDGNEHAIVSWIERDPYAFHQVGRHDFWFSAADVDQWNPVDSVAMRRVSTVGPIQDPCRGVDFEIDRLGEVLEQHFYVATARSGFVCGKVESGPQDPAEAGITGALLRPVEMPADVVDSDPDAPVRLVAAVLIALSGLHESLDVGTVEVAAHHPHALPVRPVQLAARGIEMKLLRSVCAPAGNDRRAVAPVEIDTFDRAIVGRRHAHIGPIDVARLNVDRDTIRDRASGDDRRLAGAVGVDGKQPSAAAGL